MLGLKSCRPEGGKHVQLCMHHPLGAASIAVVK